MLELRRGHVVAADGDELEVELGGTGERAAAWCDPALHPRAQVGDEVLVNVQARRLALGSGGFDVLHANLTRGLGVTAPGDAHVMKLNYTPLQHAVAPADARATDGRPVAVLAVHGQLEPLAWAFARAAPGARLGYVQTAGGALPGARSRVVPELRARGELAGHVTAGAAYGGEAEAISTAGAFGAGDWDAVVAGPGPGILGSGTELGHGGMVALDTAHAALALGLPTLLVARMSDADPRERHRGVSHHTRTVLEALLARVVVALPEGSQAGASSLLGRAGGARPGVAEIHDIRVVPFDLEAYPGPTRSMGRVDRLFVAAALAAGTVLAQLRSGIRP